MAWQPEKAAADIEKALPLASTPTLRATLYTLRATLYTLRARLALDRFEPQPAWKDALEATTLDPTNMLALQNLGTAQLLLGRESEALAALEKASGGLTTGLRCVALTLGFSGDSLYFTSENPGWVAWQKLTRGLDIATRYRLYAFLRDWANSPVAPQGDKKRSGRLKDMKEYVQRSVSTEIGGRP